MGLTPKGRRVRNAGKDALKARREALERKFREAVARNQSNE
jgi:hypothetical protein